MALLYHNKEKNKKLCEFFFPHIRENNEYKRFTELCEFFRLQEDKNLIIVNFGEKLYALQKS